MLIPCVSLSAGAALGCTAMRIALFDGAPQHVPRSTPCAENISPRGVPSNGEVAPIPHNAAAAERAGSGIDPLRRAGLRKCRKTPSKRFSFLWKSENGSFLLARQKERTGVRSYLSQDKREKAASERTSRPGRETSCTAHKKTTARAVVFSDPYSYPSAAAPGAALSVSSGCARYFLKLCQKRAYSMPEQMRSSITPASGIKCSL